MDEKQQALNTFFAVNQRCAIAFSGGADSTFLLNAAVKAGADVRAYYASSAFQPAWEKRDAERFASWIGVPLVKISIDVLADPQIARNDALRCYYCKRRLFSTIMHHARSDGFSVLLDGTNASDSASDRPGMRALAELSVLSPLQSCGLSKADIYRLSAGCGLPSAQKPAYACLATRIPTGRTVDVHMLERIEKAEDALFTAGFLDFRVRLRGEHALLELTRTDQKAYAARKNEIDTMLLSWFDGIEVDPNPRKAAEYCTSRN